MNLALKTTLLDHSVMDYMRPYQAFKLLKSFNGILLNRGEKFEINKLKRLYKTFYYHCYWWRDRDHRYFFKVSKYYCKYIRYFNNLLVKNFDRTADNGIVWRMIEPKLNPEDPNWDIDY